MILKKINFWSQFFLRLNFIFFYCTALGFFTTRILNAQPDYEKKVSGPANFAVFAGTSPEVSWLLKMLIPDDLKIEILTLSHRNHNTHTNEIRAQALSALLKADFLCQFGAGLETHWLNVPLLNARNPRLLPQAGGYCDLSIPFKYPSPQTSTFQAEGIPTHYWLGPNHFLSSARYLRDYLTLQYPMLGPRIEDQYKKLKNSLSNLSAHPDLAEIRKKKWCILGNEFLTFFGDFKISTIPLYETPHSSAPNPKQFLKWIRLIHDQKPTALLMPINYPLPLIRKIQEATQIPVIYLPLSMDQSPYPNDYIGFQYYVVSLLVEHTLKL